MRLNDEWGGLSGELIPIPPINGEFTRRRHPNIPLRTLKTGQLERQSETIKDDEEVVQTSEAPTLAMRAKTAKTWLALPPPKCQ